MALPVLGGGDAMMFSVGGGAVHHVGGYAIHGSVM